MKQNHTPVHCSPTAERGAVMRLLNAYLRETEQPDPRVRGDVSDEAPGEWRICVERGEEPFLLELPKSGKRLFGTFSHYSFMGHHRYGKHFWLKTEKGIQPVNSVEELARNLLQEWAIAREGENVTQRVEPFLRQIQNSVEKTDLYLQQRQHSLRYWGQGGREAEQALLMGHPFHPTPKSSKGFTHKDLKRYAPELGAQFMLHYFAVHPAYLEEEKLFHNIDEPIPKAVREEAMAQLTLEKRGYPLLPLHPWQARYLLRQTWFQERVQAGEVVDLGPLGDPVYPTSSVRTVCDPGFATAWKLPLRVQITNFYRTNPPDHVSRTLDAGKYIADRRQHWNHPHFGVLLDWGYRRIASWAEDTAVLFREHPFVKKGRTPWVVASLLEELPDQEPWLLQAVRRAGGELSPSLIQRWLDAYLSLSLQPILNAWIQDGISLEAHVQNALVELDEGWPVQFWVRDMEGVSISRERAWEQGKADAISPESPVLYDDQEAWKRMKYYVLTNHIGHLIHILSYHGQIDERGLWKVVRKRLLDWKQEWSKEAHPYLEDLLDNFQLPAKANLISCFCRAWRATGLCMDSQSDSGGKGG